MGSDVYMCYKKSTAKTHFLAYKPGEYFDSYLVYVLCNSHVQTQLMCNYFTGNLVFVAYARSDVCEMCGLD